MANLKAESEHAKIEYVPLGTLKEWDKNPRENDEAAKKLTKSIERFGFLNPIIADKKSRTIRAGHTRCKAVKLIAEKAGRNWKRELVPVIFVDWTNQAEAEMFAIMDNRSSEFAAWNNESLYAILENLPKLDGGLDAAAIQEYTGFIPSDIKTILDHQAEAKSDQAGSLAEAFLIPPFSIFDTRQGYWQDRKRAWLSLGIRSEVGRGDNLLNFSDTVLSGGKRNGKPLTYHVAQNEDMPGTASRQIMKGGRKGAAKTYNTSEWLKDKGLTGGCQNIPGTQETWTGTSIFDPVLCELAYSWFCPPDGRILDPFAGGSVRGIVAAMLCRKYTGIDLRPEQVAANQQQAMDIIKPREMPMPNWVVGDSLKMESILPQKAKPFDFLFTCPPYFDLEQYSNDPRDLSNGDWESFQESFGEIMDTACNRLARDRFACIVISEVRDRKTGHYRGLVPATIELMEKAGFSYYNEIILLNAVGSLPLRVRAQFQKSRKIGRCHQNILVFVKGSPEKATAACGGIQIMRPEDFQPEGGDGIKAGDGLIDELPFEPDRPIATRKPVARRK